MDKIKKNIFVVIAVIILILSGVAYLYLGKKEQEDIKAGFIQGKIAYSNIKEYRDGIILAKKGKNNLIIDVNDKVIEKIDEKATDIKLLYGGYYSYVMDGQVYLNRSGNNIKTYDALFQEEFTLYKDENDEKSEYIALNSKKIQNDIYYVTISNDTAIKTYIYNSKTGKKLYETDNYISLLKIKDKDTYEYFVVGDKELVRIEDFKTVFKENDLVINGDNNRLSVDEDIIANSQKYLVISTSDAEEEVKKYGLIDYEGNIVIPVSYEDIFFKTNNSQYIVAKKDGKYGLINSLDEEMLDFSYDAIEVYESNIVLAKNKKLGIMDNELKLIYNYQLNLADQEYNSRATVEQQNSFEVYKSSDSLIITTFPNDEKNSSTKSFNNTLIINKQNKIEEFKKQNIKYIYDQNNIIKSQYLISENIDDQTLTLNIYNHKGEQISTYETLTQESINSVTYQLINERFILINIFDKEYKNLYQCIINTSSGKVLVENEETKTFTQKQKLYEGYTYYGKDNNITIETVDEKRVINISGKDIMYLKDKNFAVKMKDNKYYICQIILENQA